MTESTTSSGYMSNNTSYLGSEVIAERINTGGLLRALKQMLEGKVVVPQPNRETGEVVYMVVEEGEPLMNPKGVQMMMMALNNIFSPFFAQGFLTRDDYERIIQENDVNLSCDLMNNLLVWDVNILNYDHILNSIVHLNQGYASQAIEGHLTNSLTQSVQLRESNTVKEGGGFALPFFNRR